MITQFLLSNFINPFFCALASFLGMSIIPFIFKYKIKNYVLFSKNHKDYKIEQFSLAEVTDDKCNKMDCCILSADDEVQIDSFKQTFFIKFENGQDHIIPEYLKHPIYGIKGRMIGLEKNTKMGDNVKRATYLFYFDNKEKQNLS